MSFIIKPIHFCKLIGIVGCFLFTAHIAYSQTILKVKPLLLPEKIAGNFGEIRGNHFHSGIDYKTNESEGQPVLAVESGHISRIKVSPVGFGKAIYIDHPNGLTTVYGHLSSFTDALNDTIRKIQYSKHQFDIEWFPDSTLFPITEGQLIGFSGNTGSSEGPHLHFETRNTKSEVPFNPELAGFQIDDTIPPVIKSLVVYQPGPGNGLYGTSRRFIPVDTLPESFLKDTLLLSNKFFIGFDAIDYAGIEPNPLGIRNFSLLLDDSTVYSCQIDSFSFDETRMVASFIDYPYWVDSNETITLCYKLPGNQLSFCKKNGNGMIGIRDTKVHTIKLLLSDSNKNLAVYKFNFRSDKFKSKTEKFEGAVADSISPCIIKKPEYELNFPANGFFEKVGIKSSLFKTPGINITSTLNVDAGNEAVNKPYQIRLKPTHLPDSLKMKLILVKINKDNSFTPAGAVTWKDGWLVASTKETGIITCVADTTPPVCTGSEIKETVNNPRKFIRFSIMDNLSGLQKVEVYCGDTWILSEYNSAKGFTDLFLSELTGCIDKKIQLRLADKTGNSSVMEFTISDKQ